MFIQHFFIEGKYLGQAERKLWLVGHYIGPPLSLAFFCRACGEIYAKMPCMAKDGKVEEWQYYGRCCRKCVPQENALVPGSVWLPWDDELIQSFPRAVLEWEFQRLLDTGPAVLG